MVDTFFSCEKVLELSPRTGLGTFKETQEKLAVSFAQELLACLAPFLE